MRPKIDVKFEKISANLVRMCMIERSTGCYLNIREMEYRKGAGSYLLTYGDALNQYDINKITSDDVEVSEVRGKAKKPESIANKLVDAMFSN